MAADRSETKARLRLAHFLSGGQGDIRPSTRQDMLLIGARAKGAAAFARQTVLDMVRDGLIVRVGGGIALSQAGAASLKRASAGDDGFLAQHRDLVELSVDTGAGPQTALANINESPLGALARRKAKDGRPFLAERELRAGERLRSDYERGGIRPRTGMNWQAAVASGRRDGGVAELTDAALAARQRVDKALTAVGPELSGVLVDICCFLKGFETVEAERGWPVRSGKVVLKTALGVLSRHYEPETHARQRPGDAILHWGAENYRPTLSP